MKWNDIVTGNLREKEWMIEESKTGRKGERQEHKRRKFQTRILLEKAKKKRRKSKKTTNKRI